MTPASIEHLGFLPSNLSRIVLEHAGIMAEVMNPPSRCEQICARYKAGEGLSDLAREFAIGPQRVWQIVNGT
jgi:hypothetical protein